MMTLLSLRPLGRSRSRLANILLPLTVGSFHFPTTTVGPGVAVAADTAETTTTVRVTVAVAVLVAVGAVPFAVVVVPPRPPRAKFADDAGEAPMQTLA